jgi:predicted transcriptional regulator
VRHQRWVNAENERKSQKRLAEAREIIVARRESGIVFLNELHSTPESKIATVEAIHAAESAGDRVVFMCADGTMSWFA